MDIDPDNYQYKRRVLIELRNQLKTNGVFFDGKRVLSIDLSSFSHRFRLSLVHHEFLVFTNNAEGFVDGYGHQITVPKEL